MSQFTKSELEKKFLDPNDPDNFNYFDIVLNTIQSSTTFTQQPQATKDKMVFACLLLDAYYNKTLNRVPMHTALGNGYTVPRLGIFGSHLTHGWPENEDQLIRRFTDARNLDFSQLANDDSLTKFRALDVGLGAFLHEVGHAHTLGIFFFNFRNRL